MRPLDMGTGRWKGAMDREGGKMEHDGARARGEERREGGWEGGREGGMEKWREVIMVLLNRNRVFALLRVLA